METQKNIDSWASLHSLLDIALPPEEQPVSEPAAEPASVLEAFVVETSAVSAELPSLPTAEPHRSEEGKRPRLDRFPKIDLWDAPQEPPLDAVVGEKRPASKSGETFTSKKLEKVELTSVRIAQRETESGFLPAPISAGQPVSKGLDPWSMIASQVGCVAAAEEVAIEEIAVPHVDPTFAPEPLGRQEWEPEAGPSKPGRRARPSMFDDGAIEESPESTAVRSIFNAEEPKNLADPANILSSILDDPPAQKDRELDRRHHVRGSRDNGFQRTTTVEGREIGQNPGTGSNEFRTEERTFNDRNRRERSVPERGQRGSRYIKPERHGVEKRSQDSRRDAPGPLDEDKFHAWDADTDSKPVERSGRPRSRRMERTVPVERTERPPSHRFREDRGNSVTEENSEDFTFASSGDPDHTHRSIPSWSDAIAAIIDANVARHAKRGPDQRRGRGVRS